MEIVMFCPNCGTENRAGVSFCEECGEPLAQKEKLAKPKRSDKSRRGENCPDCGTLNRAGVAFCEECGFDLRSGLQSKKNAAVTSGTAMPSIKRELVLFALKALVLIVLGYFTAKAVIGIF
jgi:uncharacterized membrane protein YvbJ